MERTAVPDGRIVGDLATPKKTDVEIEGNQEIPWVQIKWHANQKQDHRCGISYRPIFLRPSKLTFRLTALTLSRRCATSRPINMRRLPPARLLQLSHSQTASVPHNQDEIGRKLLQSVGMPEDAATDEMIAQAIEANDEFVAVSGRSQRATGL